MKWREGEEEEDDTSIGKREEGHSSSMNFLSLLIVLKYIM